MSGDRRTALGKVEQALRFLRSSAVDVERPIFDLLQHVARRRAQIDHLNKGMHKIWAARDDEAVHEVFADAMKRPSALWEDGHEPTQLLHRWMNEIVCIYRAISIAFTPWGSEGVSLEEFKAFLVLPQLVRDTLVDVVNHARRRTPENVCRCRSTHWISPNAPQYVIGPTDRLACDPPLCLHCGQAIDREARAQWKPERDIELGFCRSMPLPAPAPK